MDRERLVTDNGGLVKSIAYRFYQNRESNDLDLEDLIQIGYIGLIKASRKFSAEKGVKFSTYAVTLIVGEIKGYLRDHSPIKISRELKKDGIVIKRIEEEFTSKYGCSPKMSQLAKLSGMDIERVSQALMANDILHNFKNIYDMEICDIVQEKELAIDLKDSINSLQNRHKQVIILRYYNDMSQGQIANCLGISQAQVSRIEKKALAELKTIVSDTKK